MSFRNKGVTVHGNKEAWAEGESAHFEYHDNGNAQTRRRSHQVVTVLGRAEDDDYPGTFDERDEACYPHVYRVRFADGLEAEVVEDELVTGPEFFNRPDAPKE